MGSHQDWNPVVWNKGPGADKSHNKEQQVNAARRRGDVVETEKKFMGGQNKSSKSVCPNAAKVDEDTGDYHVDRVPHEVAKLLQKARLAKQMSQAKLAQAVNEKQAVIADYESGKAIPNGQVLAKLKKVLGVSLPSAKQPARPVV